MLRIFFCLLFFFLPSCILPRASDRSLETKALCELRTILNEEQAWIKVHAAEYLLWLNRDRPAVKALFLKERDVYQHTVPYRIGIFRVLSQAEASAPGRQEWIDRVLVIFGDTTAPDRIHAAESLAKLRTTPVQHYPRLTRMALTDTSRILQLYTLWATSYTSKEEEEKNKQQFIRMVFEDPDPRIRTISAYILMRSKNMKYGEWRLFAGKAIAEPVTSALRHCLLTTAFVTYPGGDTATFKKIKKAITRNSKWFAASRRIELAQALAENGTSADKALLSVYLNNGNSRNIYDAGSPEAADVRAAAAYAILKISEREHQ